MRLRSLLYITGSSLAFAALAACGGGGGGAPGNPTSVSTPPPIILDHALPAGDTFSNVGTPWDITDVRTTLYGTGDGYANTYEYLKVDVTFAQDISSALPAPGAALMLGSQLVIQVAINVAPPSGSNIAAFSCDTQATTSFNFYSYITSRLTDGNFAIVNASDTPVNQLGNTTTEAQTSVSGKTISQTFRLSVLGVPENTTAPLLGVAVDSFNGSMTTTPITNGFALTDCAPRQVLLYLTK